MTWEKARKPEEHNIGELMEEECFQEGYGNCVEG